MSFPVKYAISIPIKNKKYDNKYDNKYHNRYSELNL